MALLEGRTPPDSLLAAVERESDRAGGKLGPNLVRAAWEGDLTRVQTLLKQEADITYRDGDGFTAQDLARDQGYPEIADLLKRQEKQ